MISTINIKDILANETAVNSYKEEVEKEIIFLEISCNRYKAIVDEFISSYKSENNEKDQELILWYKLTSNQGLINKGQELQKLILEYRSKYTCFKDKLFDSQRRRKEKLEVLDTLLKYYIDATFKTFVVEINTETIIEDLTDIKNILDKRINSIYCL